MSLCAPKLANINSEFSGTIIKQHLGTAQLKAEPFCTLWQLKAKRILGLLPKYIACTLLGTSEGTGLNLDLPVLYLRCISSQLSSSMTQGENVCISR